MTATDIPLDAVYILTCRATKYRLPAAYRQLKHHGLDVLPVHTVFAPSSKIVLDTFSKFKTQPIIRGLDYMFYCSFGHYLIAHDALDRGYSRVAVFEDDFRLYRDTQTLLSYLGDVPSDMDWALLDWWPRGSCPMFNSGEFARYMAGNRDRKWVPFTAGMQVSGASGYVASANGLQAIIDIQDENLKGEQVYKVIDESFDAVMVDHYGLRAYIANPIMSRQEADSSIGGGGGGVISVYRSETNTSPIFDVNNYGI